MSGVRLWVNDTGSFGSVQSMGTINHPQAAILQVESIVKRPVVMEARHDRGQGYGEPMLILDHRVLTASFAADILCPCERDS